MTRGTDITDLPKIYKTENTCEFPDEITIRLTREAPLKYGENPHQRAALYVVESAYQSERVRFEPVKIGKGGFSATNYMDFLGAALNTLKYFSDTTVVVNKHTKPSGFATLYPQHTDRSLVNLYKRARDADARSAFGSVVVFNVPVDMDTAHAITETLVDVVAAPNFDEGVLSHFEATKKNLRVLKYSGLEGMSKFRSHLASRDFRYVGGGRALVQDQYLTNIKSAGDVIFDAIVWHHDKAHVVQRDPTPSEQQDMLTAWYGAICVPANAIVMVKDGVSVVVSSGQQERVGAVELGAVKGFQKMMDRKGLHFDALQGVGGGWVVLDPLTNPFAGAVAASDAFFPKPDSIDTLARIGVTGIIQPGGSERDYEIIDAVNRHNMAMGITRERCFKH